MNRINLFFTVSIMITMLTLSSGCSSIAKKELSSEEKAKQVKIAEVLPFEIIIDGNKAQLNSDFCAKVVPPISAVAEVMVNAKSDDIIVATIYHSDAEGIAKAGKQPFILLMGNDGKSSLDKIRNGKKLKPGFYVINVSVDKQIASVVFEIKK
jgi:hypothetical protein